MKKAIKIFLGLIIVIFLGLTIFLLTFDINRYKGKIETAASDALGRPVIISSLTMKLSFFPTIVAHNIVIKEGNEKLVQIDQTDLTMALIPLIHKRIEISSFKIGQADILLPQKESQTGSQKALSDGSNIPVPAVKQERRSDAVVAKGGKSGNNEFITNLRADEIAVGKVNLTYDKQKEPLVISNVSLKQLKSLKMKVLYDNQNFDVSATFNDIKDILLNKPNYIFEVTVKGKDVVYNLSGKIGDLQTLDNLLLNLSVKGNNLQETLFQMLKKEINSVPQTPFGLTASITGNLSKLNVHQLTVDLAQKGLLLEAKGSLENVLVKPEVAMAGSLQIKESPLNQLWGIKPMKGQFSIKGSADKIDVENLLLEAQKSDVLLQGNVDMTAQLPRVNLGVQSRYFAWEDFILSSSKKAQPDEEKSQEKSSDSPAVFAEGTVGFNFDYITGIPFVEGPFSANGQLLSEKGIVQLLLKQVLLFNGQITGFVKADVRQKPFVIGMNLTGRNLSSDAFKQNVLRGIKLDIDTKLNASGSSLDQCLRTLNGTIEAETSEGKIVSKQLNAVPLIAALFKQREGNKLSFSAADKSIELVCGAVKVPVEAGIISLDKKVVLETDILDFVLDGSIDLPKKKLDIIFSPSLVDAKDKVNVALNLMQNIKLAGPFNALKVSVVGGEQLVQQGLRVAEAFLNKQTASQTTQTTTGAMCQSVLGRSLKKKVKVPARTQRVAPEQKETEKAQPELKEQLFDALSQVLK